RVIRRTPVAPLKRRNYLPEPSKPGRKHKKTDQRLKPKLALLIAAHNEEMVLEQTLRSAIRAGMKPEHIYVVDDNSSDATSQVAKSIIGETNVIKVRRSGKGLALTKAAKHFRLA